MSEAPLLVVIDVATLVTAQAFSSPSYRSWPHPPAASTNRSADAVAVTLRRRQWGLALSQAILENTFTTLRDVWGLPAAAATDYVDALREVADVSGGGVFVVSQPSLFGSGAAPWMGDVARLILSTFADAAVIARSRPPLELGVWEGCWITDPTGFASRAHTISG